MHGKLQWIGPALAVLTLALISGCEFGNVFTREDSSPAEFQDDPRADGGSDNGSVVEYLDVMRRLVEGDVLTQTETFREIAEAAAASPTTENRVKLALAVATPGHPNENPAEAQQRLSSLLAAGPALLPEERMLVAIHLKEVEQRLILDAEARRLRDEAEAARAARNDESARRLEAALAENARLARELEEAQQKLDAITNIERSIRERENGSNP
ncbi:MAG TPA: hypothetical protein VF339_06690 [Gammaproteobacteria bacterium]